jgi:acyl-CoA dehydrogenase
VARGDKIAAFALERARRRARTWRYENQRARSPRLAGPPLCLHSNGTKTWISNGGIADFYCVFAKTDPAAGTRGITAFIVDADTPGLDSTSTSR